MALIRAVLDWSRNASMRRVRLWVVPNSAGDRLYRRAQFIPTKAEKVFPNDDSRTLIEMQLDLG